MQGIDWATRLLYVTAFIGLLFCGAILLFALCYYTNSNEDDTDETIDPTKRAAKGQRADNGEKKPKPKQKLLAFGKQTIVPALAGPPVAQGNAEPRNDTLLATAMSSIPMSQFQHKNQDVIVDIQQQMLMNQNELGQDDHECIVCKNHKEITWKQVSCYAQTSVGILVLKREYTTNTEQSKPTPQASSSSSSAADQAGLSPAVNPEKRHEQTTVSNLTLAPIPDSRLNIRPPEKLEIRERSKSSPRSRSISKSKSKSPPKNKSPGKR